MSDINSGDGSRADVAAFGPPGPSGRSVPLPWEFPTARLDPWLLAEPGGVTILFGYCRWHEKLGGLSWLVSSPVLELDTSRLRARTLSGRIYALGQRIAADDLPDDEALLAHRLLTGHRTWRKDRVPLADLSWLSALKVSRWLGVEAPARGRIDELRGFLAITRTAYRAALQAAGVGMQR